MRICVCGVHVPFSRGGAEALVESLAEELRRRGAEVDVVSLPFTWRDRTQLFRSALSWRMLDLSEVDGERIDMVIATRFPSYVVHHPNKVVWLVHQLRQAYDLKGTTFSDFGKRPGDEEAGEMLRAMDARTLNEARRVFAISRNVADRLERWNGLKIDTLHPPPKLVDRLHSGDYGEYVFTAGRLNPIKRFDLLIRALAHTHTPVRAVIAGAGDEEARLRGLAHELGVAGRVEFPGAIDDSRLIELYAGCLCVFYAPYDEDYGFVTVEAGKAGKAVVSTSDSGGVLEFVVDGKNGFVCDSAAPRAIGARLDTLYSDRRLARTLGEEGTRRVAEIQWDHVIERLIG